MLGRLQRQRVIPGLENEDIDLICNIIKGDPPEVILIAKLYPFLRIDVMSLSIWNDRQVYKCALFSEWCVWLQNGTVEWWCLCRDVFACYIQSQSWRWYCIGAYFFKDSLHDIQAPQRGWLALKASQVTMDFLNIPSTTILTIITFYFFLHEHWYEDLEKNTKTYMILKMVPRLSLILLTSS